MTRPVGDSPTGLEGETTQVRGGKAAVSDEDKIAALVQAAAAGDQGAWDALVDRFAGMIWAIARAHRLSYPDVADVSQIVWLRLAQRLSRLREPGRLGGWLATVTRHECYRVLRKAGREVLTDNDLDLPDDGRPPEAGLLAREREKAVRQVLEILPAPRQRLMLMLMADPSPSYADVAAVLDMPVGSIGPTRQRCLEKLRHELRRAFPT